MLKRAELVMLAVALATCHGAARQEKPVDAEQQILMKEADNLIIAWLDAVDRATAAGFVRVERLDQLPAQARADSVHWAQYFFTDASSPHNPALQLAHSFHLARADTPDLVRHDYRAAALALRVVESRNYTFVFIEQPPILETAAEKRKAVVEQTAHAVLRMDDARWPQLAHTWRFVLPALVEEGTRFSTRPTELPEGMPSWTSRVDGGVHHGELYFLCYKKRDQMQGFLNSQSWFDPEFRSQHETSGGERR